MRAANDNYGMDRKTGKPLTRLQHIIQSINTILTTPIGSMLLRRLFGSYIFALIDAPFNALTRQRLIAACVDAIHRWEPRVRLTRVEISLGQDQGQFLIRVDAQVKDTLENVNTTVEVRRAA